MSNYLKQILLRMARLPSRDQDWIIRQLSKEQRLLLDKHQGMVWLNEAQRYKSLPEAAPAKHVAEEDEKNALPASALDLLVEAPLYVAIVLAQGDYPWQPLLLQTADNDGAIRNALVSQVPDLKHRVKTAVFEDWQQRLSFEHVLEGSHG